jgi:hypothetical protein
MCNFSGLHLLLGKIIVWGGPHISAGACHKGSGRRGSVEDMSWFNTGGGRGGLFVFSSFMPTSGFN